MDTNHMGMTWTPGSRCGSHKSPLACGNEGTEKKMGNYHEFYGCRDVQGLGLRLANEEMEKTMQHLMSLGVAWASMAC